jgi:hypothetical protein
VAGARALNTKDPKTAQIQSIHPKLSPGATRSAAQKPTAFRADPTVFLVFSALFAFFVL